MDIGMPIRETKGPVEGQKFIYVEDGIRGPELKSGVLRRRVSVIGVSNCQAASHAERVPIMGCRCGFYMWSGVDGQVPWNGDSRLALAIVRGTGKTIEHERGHRSQFQRILSVEFMPWCSCGNPANRLSPCTSLGALPPLLRPVCESHGGSKILSLSQVERRIRVPVTWTQVP